MPNHLIVLDVASAPVANVEDYIGTPKPRKGTKDEDKQQEQIAAKRQALIESAGLDLDLARLTGIGKSLDGGPVEIDLCRTEADECMVLRNLAAFLSTPSYRLVTYGGFNFDIPLLMRRARYLGVKFPIVNLDRYRSPHHDLLLDLSDRDKQRYKPLGFYVRRLGMDLQKPLDGAEESRVHDTGKWVELEASILHDVTATTRLAQWMGVLAPDMAEAAF
jgi:hypothetical protein